MSDPILPFILKYENENYAITDANFACKSHKLRELWFWKHQKSYIIPKNPRYTNYTLTFICEYLNGKQLSPIEKGQFDVILLLACKLGCEEFVVNQLESCTSIFEIYDAYLLLIGEGISSEKIIGIMAKHMEQSDDFLSAASFPIEILLKISKNLSGSRKVQLAVERGDSSACLLLLDINPSELTLEDVLKIGSIPSGKEIQYQYQESLLCRPSERAIFEQTVDEINRAKMDISERENALKAFEANLKEREAKVSQKESSHDILEEKLNQSKSREKKTQKQLKDAKQEIKKLDTTIAELKRSIDEQNRKEQKKKEQILLSDKPWRIVEECPDFAKYIANKGYNPTSITMPPLHFAALQGSIDYVCALLKMGALINLSDNVQTALTNDGAIQTFLKKTALHYAVKGDAFSVVKYLVKDYNGIDINRKDNNNVFCI